MEPHGDLGEGREGGKTDEVNLVGGLDEVVIGGVLEVQGKHTLLLEVSFVCGGKKKG